MSNIPDGVIVQAIRALSGEITDNMRLVAFKYDGSSATFHYYTRVPPSEIDRENAEVVAMNFEAGHQKKLRSLNIEFTATMEKLGKLDCLDFGLYRKSE